MKKLVVLSIVAAAAGTVAAQEQGRVVSSSPIVEQVSVPRQVCDTQTYATAPRPSGAGALIGAITGGVVGNQIGGGSGRAAATALGAVGGAVVGNQIEGNNGQPRYQSVERCHDQSYYESRTVGYNVTYEYAGRRYTTRTSYPPGAYVPVQVSPADGYGESYDTAPEPVYSQPGYVVPAAPPAVYAPTYYERQPYYYPQPGVSIEYNSSPRYRNYSR